MPEARIRDGKVFLERSTEERKPFVHALNRIEGQIRGVRAMIEEDRYCGDELQQIKAAISSLQRVARLLTQQHIDAANTALLSGAPPAIVGADMSLVLQKILDL